jgi:hypothetical protein
MDPAPGMPATELSGALVSRQCTKRMSDGTPVIPEHIALLQEAGTGRDVRCLILTENAQISAVSELVERGNLAQLTDEDFREELLTWLRFSPGAALFLAGTDTRAAWVEAGRAYERFALQAELLDIRSAFLNQPIEVPALRDELRALLHLTEAPQLMVRFGHGARAPYSLRRPPHDVIVD